MISISSNTIVKDGMPFIGKVLEQVAPFMEEMIVTVSQKSSDGTLHEVQKVYEKYPEKVRVDFENVPYADQLTEVQNAQAERTKSEWILFLSDDDFWPQEQFPECLDAIGKDPLYLAYDVSPFQLIDTKHHDGRWRNRKWFSKFLRREGMQYVGSWPREMPCDKEGRPLYWKTHNLVKHLPYFYYHLPLMKQHSFRNEIFGGKYRYPEPNVQELDHEAIL